MTQEQRDYAIYLYKNVTNNKTHIARELIKKFKLSITADGARKAVRRWVKNIDSTGLVEQCEEAGLPIDKVNHYWYKGEHFSIHVKDDNIVSYDEVRDEIIASMRDHAPMYPTIVRRNVSEGHLLVVDPADIHIGKLATAMETGEEYNSQIAVQRVKEGVQGILDKSEGFNIDKILFVAGNDILHIDTPHRTTTKGTPQDTDGMWYENFLIAKKLYVEVIEVLLAIADVHFMFNPSNHDYTNGFFLADTISTWFMNCANITFDVSINHRKYYRYGANLIGTTHGDGGKLADLPLIMAQEAKVDWGKTKHKYIYTHHLHHKVSKDHIGVTVESLRSPSGTDGWHHRKGYAHAPKAVEGFIHHKDHGQVARITHLF